MLMGGFVGKLLTELMQTGLVEINRDGPEGPLFGRLFKELHQVVFAYQPEIAGLADVLFRTIVERKNAFLLVREDMLRYKLLSFAVLVHITREVNRGLFLPDRRY